MLSGKALYLPEKAGSGRIFEEPGIFHPGRSVLLFRLLLSWYKVSCVVLLVCAVFFNFFGFPL